MSPLQQLMSLLQVTPNGDGQFIGKPGTGKIRIYGGLTLTQAVDAVRQSCPEEYVVQSLHGQFLRPGDFQHPIDISVEALKDGRRFKIFNVYCRQQGKTIFFATVTFHLPEQSFEHTLNQPHLDLPGQDTAHFFADRLHPADDDESDKSSATLEVRIDNINQFDQTQEPEQTTWIRALGDDIGDLTPWQHTLLLAYISDWNMPLVAVRPHTINEKKRPNIASLDHSLWFYRQPDLSNWAAYIQDSPAALNGRGHTRGLFYSQQGELLACANQECFMIAENIKK